jgi:hypothetical protein
MDEEELEKLKQQQGAELRGQQGALGGLSGTSSFQGSSSGGNSSNPINGITGAISNAGKSAWGWLNPMNDFKAGYQKPDPEVAAAIKNWALTGQGPSAAQAMVAQERAKNIAAAQSMAKSTPGLSLAGQQRLAQAGASRAIAEASSKGATLRAQEQQQAMQNQLDQYRTMAQAYADAMRANAQVASENAGTRRGIFGGLIKGVTGLAGL